MCTWSPLFMDCLVVPLAGHVALSLVHQCALGVDQTKQRSMPKCVIDVCRMVYQAKCSLIKVRENIPSSAVPVEL